MLNPRLESRCRPSGRIGTKDDAAGRARAKPARSPGWPAGRSTGRRLVQGTVDFMLQFAPGVSPHYFERARRPGVSLRGPFERRLGALTASLGEPSIEDEPAWYPRAAAAAF